MKAIQYFTDEYLEQCKRMTHIQILQFLEDFRLLHSKAKPVKSKLISIKVPEDLLSAFKTRSELEGVKYQTQIKTLMKEYLRG